MTYEVEGSRGKHVPFRLVIERGQFDTIDIHGIAVLWAGWAERRRSDGLPIVTGFVVEAIGCSLDAQGEIQPPVPVLVFQGEASPLASSAILHRDEEQRQTIQALAIYLREKIGALRITIYHGVMTWAIEGE